MIVNDINLPSPILNAMRNNTYTAGNADYTPSSLAKVKIIKITIDKV